ncbi:MAG: hypothetical protein ACRDQ4_03955 [Pseudonocardiaceae bacterium]
MSESPQTQSVVVLDPSHVPAARVLAAAHGVEVERDDHKIVTLEVKLSSTVDDSDVTHLHWLRNHLGPNILDTAVHHHRHLRLPPR